ncbi:MAG: Lrp/AsnC family transcriptional regulator [Candidatus Aenigmarchaeota archaeon]|nr:Lrp/AsnC family transcriptional regulator [Candidatus Aenigmarchaeota archaeon]
MIDNRDKMLIRELEKNSKLSSRKLAMKSGLPISTTHRRVKILEKEGVIKGYKAIVDYEKIGKPVGLILLINIAEDTPKESYVPLNNLKEELKKFDEIHEILEVKSEKWDLFIKARLNNLKDTNPFLEKMRKIKGVEEVNSIIITDEIII